MDEYAGTRNLKLGEQGTISSRLVQKQLVLQLVALRNNN
jgi:hypothetical protein